MEMKLHNSLKTIPVYNYFMLTETGDLRYLIAKIDVFDLPEKEAGNEAEFGKAYENILKEMPEKENKLQQIYFECLQLIFTYLDTKENTDLQRYNNKYTRYLETLDEFYTDFNFDNQIFKSSKDVLKHIKTKYDISKELDKYLTERLLQLYYGKITARSKHKWDLYDDIAVIKQVSNIDIDEFTCSMFKFMKFKELTQKSIDYRKKLKNGKI